MIKNPYFRGLLRCEVHKSEKSKNRYFGPFTLNPDPAYRSWRDNKPKVEDDENIQTTNP